MQNCDALIFYTFELNGIFVTTMNFMQAANDSNVIPSEVGHKYNIVLFKELNPSEEEVEIFAAILGDPYGYVKRMGKGGYTGMLCKINAWKGIDRDNLIEMTNKFLSVYKFGENLISKVVTQTVV